MSDLLALITQRLQPTVHRATC